MIKINLYDFDKTIYDGDSTADFMKYILKKHPSTIRFMPRMGIAALKYALKIIDKTKMKEEFYSIFSSIDDIDKLLEEFWKTHENKIKDFYLEKDHSNDIIISASPEFLLKPMTDKLKVKDMMASKVNKKTGKYEGINCHDVEKVRRLNEKYSNYKVMESFSDSITSDKPILELAENAYQVKGKKLIKVKFKK